MESLARTLSYLIVVVAVAAFWEFVAWSMHKYIMHGPGWFLHADHHMPTRHGLQKNDAYILVFAFASFLCIYNGLLHGLPYLTAAGFGIALYGLSYVLFHEILFHKRLNWLRIPVKGLYLKTLVAAHTIHHQVARKEGGSHYSFLWPAPVPVKAPGRAGQSGATARPSHPVHGDRPTSKQHNAGQQTANRSQNHATQVRQGIKPQAKKRNQGSRKR